MSHPRVIQYLQIDFLRLFRLCKNLGYISKKRKMPIEYNVSNDSDIYKIILNFRNLLKVFITNLFKNDFSYVKVYGLDLSISFKNIKDIIYFGNNPSNYSKEEKEKEDIFRKIIEPETTYLLSNLTSYNPHIITRFTGSGFRRYYLKLDENPKIYAYNTAVELLKFKNLWDQVIPFLQEKYLQKQSENLKAQEAVEKIDIKNLPLKPLKISND